MEMNLREVVVRQMSEMKNNLLGMEGDQENFCRWVRVIFFSLCVCGGVWGKDMGNDGPAKWGLIVLLVSQLNMRGAVEFNHILVRLKLSLKFLLDRIQ